MKGSGIAKSPEKPEWNIDWRKHWPHIIGFVGALLFSYAISALSGKDPLGLLSMGIILMIWAVFPWIIKKCQEV